MSTSCTRNDGSNSVIVRVKRGRDQLAPDTICIMDDDSLQKKKKVSMNDLTTAVNDENENKRRRKNFVVLRRVETVSQKESALLDSETLQCLNKPMLQKLAASTVSAGGEASSAGTKATAAAVFVNKGTKVMKSGDYEDVFVVDMVQQKAGSSSTKIGSGSGKVVGNKIFSPISKMLDKAIVTAYKTGDFSAISSLMEQGADINYQRTKSDGLTCLMVAAHHGNSKILAKLLAKKADITMGDVNGLTALDYVKNNLTSHSSSSMGATKQKPSAGRVGAAMECSLLLHNAITVMAGAGTGAIAPTKPGVSTTKRITKSSRSAPPSASAAAASAAFVADAAKKAAESSLEAMVEDDGECVYDVYCLQQSALRQALNTDGVGVLPPLGSQTHGTGVSLEDDASAEVEELEYGTHIMQVPGLHIDNYGQLITYTDHAEQQHFVYDSDWSDLGDDEDPDSNDERFGGNDYPEDEDDEDDEDEANLRQQAKERQLREMAYRQKHNIDSSAGGLKSNAKPSGPFAPVPDSHRSDMFGTMDAADEDSDSEADGNDAEPEDQAREEEEYDAFYTRNDDDEYDCTTDYNEYINNAYDDDYGGSYGCDDDMGSQMPKFARNGGQTGRVLRPQQVSFEGESDCCMDENAMDDGRY